MRQILSVGKSIKIVRFLENNHLLYAAKPQKKRRAKDDEIEERETAQKVRRI
jgi:hypothetical protein